LKGGVVLRFILSRENRIEAVLQTGEAWKFAPFFQVSQTSIAKKGEFQMALMVTIEGFLWHDPKFFEARGTGNEMLSFSIGSEWQEKPSRMIWLNCLLYGKTASNVAPYLRKGSKVLVSGSLLPRSGDDRENGNVRWTLYVNQMEFLPAKEDVRLAERRKNSMALTGKEEEEEDDINPFA